jgi:hypothetical protein
VAPNNSRWRWFTAYRTVHGVVATGEKWRQSPSETPAPDGAKDSRMAEMQIKTGGCLCGQIRYALSGPRGVAVLCHCRMCQRASGAPLAAIQMMPAEAVKVTAGATRSFNSSVRAHREFCPRCGSQLFFKLHTRTDLCGVFVGSLDDPNDFAPDMQVCVSSSVTWLDVSAAAPCHDEKPANMTPTLCYDPVTGRTWEA